MTQGAAKMIAQAKGTLQKEKRKMERVGETESESWNRVHAWLDNESSNDK